MNKLTPIILMLLPCLHAGCTFDVGISCELVGTCFDASITEPPPIDAASEPPKQPLCGDGVLDPGEFCDDGNSVSGDGCSADCLSGDDCGDGSGGSGEGGGLFRSSAVCREPWAETHCFAVTVNDASGAAVADVEVSAQGVSYVGASMTKYTDAAGQVCVEIKRDGTADIIVGTPGAPLATASVTGNGEASNCAGNGAACTAVTIELEPAPVICTPGAEELCPYNGPSGTEGIGICRAGTTTCNSDGTAWSSCAGEVLPEAEDLCSSPFDDDCDGTVDDEVGCPSCSIGDPAINCYSGPVGTEGVGMCVAGTRTCTPEGVYGPCEGEVTPQPESCDTTGDDDCDGSSSCVETTQWAYDTGGGGSDESYAIAVDSNGNVLVTGYFSGTVDFGGGPLTSAGGYDVFVVKLGTDGEHLWSRRFGSVSQDQSDAIAVDSDGNVVVTGYFRGTLDFGGGPLTSAGDYDVFVVKLDEDGGYVWSQRFGDSNNDYGDAVAVDSSGDVLLTGYFYDTLDFGGGLLTSAGELDVFVVKLNVDGGHVWSHRFGGLGYDYGYGIAVDRDGSVLLTGYFHGTVDFGGGPLTSSGFWDAFAVKLSVDGGHMWSHRFGGLDDEVGRALAVDSDGNVVLTGEFQGTVDFGGGPLTSAGDWDTFVVKLSGDGEHVWSQRFGDSGFDFGDGVVMDSDGNVVVTGRFTDTVDFGGGPLTSAGSYDVFAVKLSVGGGHVWSQRFGGSSSDRGRGIAVDSGGGVLLTGEFHNTVNFGTGPLQSSSNDTFVVKLTP